MCGCCAPKPNAAAASSPGLPIRKRACSAPPTACRSARLLDEIASDYRGGDVEIRIEMEAAAPPEPKVWRVPEVLHGLGNIIANAADFAQSLVRVRGAMECGRASPVGGG